MASGNFRRKPKKDPGAALHRLRRERCVHYRKWGREFGKGATGSWSRIGSWVAREEVSMAVL